MTVKDHVRGSSTFQYYRKGFLYYLTDTGFTFRVPVDDTGDGTFLATERSILFMRYIRKELESHG